MVNAPVLVDVNGLRMSLLVDPIAFASRLTERIDGNGVGEGATDLLYATEVAANLEDLKIAVAFVRRQSMLDERIRVGNTAEVGRRAGVLRSRAHAMVNRATHERIHGLTLADVLENGNA